MSLGILRSRGQQVWSLGKAALSATKMEAYFYKDFNLRNEKEPS
jgi:hypothetical protein